MGECSVIAIDRSLNPSPEQQSSNHGTATVSRHCSPSVTSKNNEHFMLHCFVVLEVLGKKKPLHDGTATV